MEGKKLRCLQKVAHRTGFSYQYVKMVNCGMRSNREVLVEIARIKEEEAAELRKRAARIKKDEKTIKTA